MKTYSWRHGWIPLTHAAAMAKAKDNAKLAQSYLPQLAAPKRRRATPAHVLEYHAARAEQDRRFEDHTGGGISAADTHTQEYRDYFGTGDHRAGKVEDRITYREHLARRGAEAREDKARGRAYAAGVKLGRRHHSAGLSTTAENAEFDQAAGKVEFPEHFEQGYGDGLSAAYESATKPRAGGRGNPLVKARL